VKIRYAPNVIPINIVVEGENIELLAQIESDTSIIIFGIKSTRFAILQLNRSPLSPPNYDFYIRLSDSVLFV
jgi:hypothetical protein